MRQGIRIDMTSHSQTVHLLILTSRADEAADIITTLRTGGIPARGLYTSQCERIAELTSTAEPIDLILCCANDPAIEASQVMAHYRAITADIPLVILTSASADPAVFLDALRAGARDLVPRGQIERLQLIVARELADRRARERLTQLELQLQLCEQRALELVEKADDPIAVVREGVHIYTNAAYQRRFGFATAEELDGLPLLDLIGPEYHEPVRELLRRDEEADSSELSIDTQVSCLRADGTSFPAMLTLSRAETDGAPCLRVTLRDAAVGASPTTTAIDAETGLANRSTLLSEIQERLDRSATSDPADPAPFALLYIGINGFEEIMRTAGSVRTFEIAAGFGVTLRRLAPPNALVARLTDDGFMLLSDDLDPAEAKALLVTIRREIRLPVTLPNRDTAQPDCITGLVGFDGGDASPGELIDQAYANAFKSLAPEEGLVTTEGPPLQGAALEGTRVQTDVADREIAEKIDDALRTDGFKLVYQPIVSLLGDSQENYSVLVRLLDEQQRLHEARELVGPAVRTGRIEAMDRWVLREGIKEVAEQRRNGQKINFFINLAERTFLEPTLLLWICDRLREYEARGSWLTFQFQEIHARQHLTRLNKVVDGLTKIKARIALSRFGHDPQPDALLQTLQVDFVLFAPDFAERLSEDDEKQERLMQLANHAREFNVKTVVTGVEDANTLTVLWGAGIDYVQGNFLQRPSAVLAVEQD